MIPTPTLTTYIIWPYEWKVVKVYTINGFSSHAGRDDLIYDEFKIPT
ncbi:MAG: hypothetical protein ACO2OT_03905 [Candidatus Caldipriscus sp.]